VTKLKPRNKICYFVIGLHQAWRFLGGLIPDDNQIKVKIALFVGIFMSFARCSDAVLSTVHCCWQDGPSTRPSRDLPWFER
jgi:hypothetical protein